MSRATSNTSSIINLLAGIWLILSPFMLNYAAFGISATNMVTVGVIAVILALIKLASPNASWASWINLLLGLWLIISPFTMAGASVGRVVTNDLIVGIIMAAFSLTAAFSTPTIQSEA